MSVPGTSSEALVRGTMPESRSGSVTGKVSKVK